eukprot:scaffold2653_cov242-Chaetoceros_neogracile.AAC.3
MARITENFVHHLLGVSGEKKRKGKKIRSIFYMQSERNALATSGSQSQVKPTPCNRICRYNSNFFDGEVCIGCFRDTHEISNWVSMTSSEKSYALEDAAGRSTMATTFDGAISEEELRRQANAWIEFEQDGEYAADHNSEGSSIDPDPIEIKQESVQRSVCIDCFRDSFEIENWISMSSTDKMYALQHAADRCEENSNIEQFEGGISRQELLRQARMWTSYSKDPVDERWEEINIKTGERVSFCMPLDCNNYHTFIRGESVILMEKVVSDEDCSAIKVAAKLIASRQRELRLEAGLMDEGHVRIPTMASAKRASSGNTPCVEPFDSDIDAKLNQIMARVCKLIDSEHKTMQQAAVNFYTSGSFRPHEDGQKLTVLITLSSANEFEGGGTAFWSSESRGHRVEDPSLELKPDYGTVMLFVGHVTHAGLTVKEGERAIFVASFSPIT